MKMGIEEKATLKSGTADLKSGLTDLKSKMKELDKKTADILEEIDNQKTNLKNQSAYVKSESVSETSCLKNFGREINNYYWKIIAKLNTYQQDIEKITNPKCSLSERMKISAKYRRSDMQKSA